MGLLLKEALRRLCIEIGWSYAVFWREIGCDRLRHLVWEEGHYESTRVFAVSGISGRGTTDSLLNEWEMVRSFHEEQFGELRCQGEDKVGNLVSKIMLSQVHIVGDGIIGRAAVTGNHQWILQNSLMVEGHAPEGLTEMKHQFLAGIQTIAVIPVLPHGVVQLGSNQMIMENAGIVNHVRSLFVQLGCVPGTLSSDSTKKMSDVPITSKPRATILVNSVSDLSEPKAYPPVKPILPLTGQPEGGSVGAQVVLPCTGLQSNQVTSVHNSSSGREQQATVVSSVLSSGSSIFLKQQLLSIVGPEKFPNNLSTDNTKRLPLRLHGYTSTSSQEDSVVSLLGKSDSLPCGTLTLDNGGNQKINSPGIGAHRIIKNTNHSSGNNVLLREVTESLPPAVNEHMQSMATLGKGNVENDLFQAFDISFKDYWLNTANPIQRCQTGACEENDFSTTQNGSNAKGDDKYKSLDTITLDASDVSVLCTSRNDLFDALGPDFKSRHFPQSFDSVFINMNVANAGESVTDVSTCVTQMDADSLLDSKCDGISSNGIFLETGPDQLLDAVISKISSGSRQSTEDSACCKIASTKMANSSLHTHPPKNSIVSSFTLSPILSEAENTVSVSLNSAGSVVKTGECSQRDGVYKSQISLWVESGQNMKSEGMPDANCKRFEETGKTNRKRPRPGENTRPRPKDRQMIQDRFKELREIVPNGTKLSIDALLERTIKHMLFLQSVTKHADKLKETGVQKIISKEGGLLLKDNFEGGATWAFEVGTESMICPIIVEDLNPPRQLLVEMLCEQRGFFLEIASLIRELGLTILRGVMESRNHKLWARFAVEANKDVTRMDIFLSLLRLLEPTSESSILPQGIDNVEIAHDMICQSSIPATGLYSHMQ